MQKQTLYNTEARTAIKAGVDTLADAVKVTLGPKGRLVIINKGTPYPIITKDGVTVAREVHLEDAMQNTGAQMIRGVAEKTVEMAGDGTTTATILAQAIMTAGLKNLAAGANPMDMKRGIDAAVTVVVENLKKQSVPIGDGVEKIKQVALVSTNNDEDLAELIADATYKVGKDGQINIEDSNDQETKIKFEKGYSFDKGLMLPHFVTNPVKERAELEDCLILLMDKKISSQKMIVPLLEKIRQTDLPLLIISEDVEHGPMQVLLANQQKGNMKFAVVKSPGYGEDAKLEILKDIATITGADIIFDQTTKLDQVTLNQLGRAKLVNVDRYKTTIIGGAGDKQQIDLRIQAIENFIKETHDEQDKEDYKERLAKIKNGVATIYVGGATEIEANERKDRIDDAIRATQCAMQEGIVPGGGMAYIRAIPFLKRLLAKGTDDYKLGVNIIRHALEEPLRQICENAGVYSQVIINRVMSGEEGYNARTGEYEDLIKSGVIDPTKVARIALENAASISSMLLSTECLVMNTK